MVIQYAGSVRQQQLQQRLPPREPSRTVASRSTQDDIYIHVLIRNHRFLRRVVVVVVGQRWVGDALLVRVLHHCRGGHPDNRGGHDEPGRLHALDGVDVVLHDHERTNARMNTRTNEHTNEQTTHSAQPKAVVHSRECGVVDGPVGLGWVRPRHQLAADVIAAHRYISELLCSSCIVWLVHNTPTKFNSSQSAGPKAGVPACLPTYLHHRVEQVEVEGVRRRQHHVQCAAVKRQRARLGQGVQQVERARALVALALRVHAHGLGLGQQAALERFGPAVAELDRRRPQ